jgi:hypothetical protein
MFNQVSIYKRSSFQEMSNKSRTNLLILANEDCRNMIKRCETKLNSKEAKEYEKEYAASIIHLEETTFLSSANYLQASNIKIKIDENNLNTDFPEFIPTRKNSLATKKFKHFNETTLKFYKNSLTFEDSSNGMDRSSLDITRNIDQKRRFTKRFTTNPTIKQKIQTNAKISQKYLKNLASVLNSFKSSAKTTAFFKSKILPQQTLKNNNLNNLENIEKNIPSIRNNERAKTMLFMKNKKDINSCSPRKNSKSTDNKEQQNNAKDAQWNKKTARLIDKGLPELTSNINFDNLENIILQNRSQSYSPNKNNENELENKEYEPLNKYSNNLLKSLKSLYSIKSIDYSISRKSSFNNAELKLNPTVEIISNFSGEDDYFLNSSLKHNTKMSQCSSKKTESEYTDYILTTEKNRTLGTIEPQPSIYTNSSYRQDGSNSFKLHNQTVKFETSGGNNFHIKIQECLRDSSNSSKSFSIPSHRHNQSSELASTSIKISNFNADYNSNSSAFHIQLNNCQKTDEFYIINN